VDSAGGIYVSDNSAVVRKFFVGGPISTIAGNSISGYAGDGGTATSAQLNRPTGMAVDSQGRVYVADTANNAIRLLQPNASGITVAAVTNGASNQTGAISPGEVIVLYGSGMGPSTLATYQVTNDSVPKTVGGTSVYVNGAQAPLIYSSATQVGAIVPFAVSGSTAQVYVTYQGQTSTPVSVSLGAASPALFTLDNSGKGQVAAVNFISGTNYSINGPSHPANAGQYVELYGTGFGQTNPGGVDGSINSGSSPPLVTPLPTVTIGGKQATVSYAGGAAASPAGVIQINVQVPAGLSAGSQPIVVQFGNAQSQSGITLSVSGQ
jgi:uncharacterized protein (TIGR03437 family)